MFNPSDYITIWDWLLSFIYMGFIIIAMYVYTLFKRKNDPIYKWLIPAFIVKCFGGIAVLMIYAYYYTEGGDTYSYFDNTKKLLLLTFENPQGTLRLLLGENTYETFSFFPYSIGKPWADLFFDDKTWAVSRFTYPFVLLGFGRIMTSTILFNAYALIGPWKLFRLLCEQYPDYRKKLAFAMFFIPSCIFWGSGLYKDSFTLSSTLWIFYSILQITLNRKKIGINLFLIILNSYIIISVKPYIFVVLLPAVLILFTYSSVKKIKNKALRILALPSLTIIVFAGGLLLFSSLSSSLGQYGNMTSMINKLIITREDFIHNKTYSTNFFDIGEFEPSFLGVLKKVPLAFLYGLLGPFPWQVTNPVIAISSLEGSLFLILFILSLRAVLFQKNVFKNLSDPIFISFLFFSVILVIFVGLSTPNFGSLVRYRIPALPLYLFCMIHVISLSKKESQKRNIY
ncbi:MAG: hypothetical protein GX259_02405 [Bacteroidales bacterium]|nr:hypothetical protein [Bacteroidales bacterium]